MEDRKLGRAIEILMVEDSPTDALLAKEALREGKIQSNLNVVEDGEEAMDYLRRVGKYADKPRPDIIFLDLNMPKMDGREVLTEIQKDKDLMRIPIVVLTTSKSEEDIVRSYDLNANCYISKPVDFDQFIKIVDSIEQFWFTVVALPSK